MEHTHIGLPSIYMCQGRGQGRRQDQPPLHTGYGCCIYMWKKQACCISCVTVVAQKHPFKDANLPSKSEECDVIHTDIQSFTLIRTAAFTLSHSVFKDPSSWNESRQYALAGSPTLNITQMESLSSLVQKGVRNGYWRDVVQEHFWCLWLCSSEYYNQWL